MWSDPTQSGKLNYSYKPYMISIKCCLHSCMAEYVLMSISFENLSSHKFYPAKLCWKPMSALYNWGK